MVRYVAACRAAARSSAACRSCGERQHEYVPEFVQFRPKVLVQKLEGSQRRSSLRLVTGAAAKLTV